MSDSWNANKIKKIFWINSHYHLSHIMMGSEKFIDRLWEHIRIEKGEGGGIFGGKGNLGLIWKRRVQKRANANGAVPTSCSLPFGSRAIVKLRTLPFILTRRCFSQPQWAFLFYPQLVEILFCLSLQGKSIKYLPFWKCGLWELVPLRTLTLLAPHSPEQD